MTLIIALLLAPWTILTICFAVEVFTGLKRLPRPEHESAVDQSAVIIVPAHDEELLIHSGLQDLKRAAAGLARILIVADNCADRTAQIARALDVEVIERHDLTLRGKGYALDFARTHLKAAPPAVILIVDADCAIDAESIQRLIASCAAVGRPCQASNLQRPSPAASPAVQVSTFAFFVRNIIRQRALTRLAGRAHLLGTGMALPWRIYAAAELATSNIVEDLKLGQDLADSGHAPLFLEQAEVWSRAESDANTLSQRQRWEGGFLRNARQAGPKLLAKGLIRADTRLIWAAIDLVIPPFALLIFLDVLAFVVAAAFTWAGLAYVWPLLGLGAALLAALFALALAWLNGGSRFVSLGSLARAPLYVAWKLPMYVGLALRGAPKQWLRTGR